MFLLIGLRSRFGDKLLQTVKFVVVCPQNGTAALKGLNVFFHEFVRTAARAVGLGGDPRHLCIQVYT